MAAAAAWHGFFGGCKKNFLMTEFTRARAIAAPYGAADVDRPDHSGRGFLKYPRFGRGSRPGPVPDVREKGGFVLDHPPYDKARIFVAAENFGIGPRAKGRPMRSRRRLPRADRAEPSATSLQHCMKKGIRFRVRAACLSLFFA